MRYPCKLCDATFLRRDVLLRHEARHEARTRRGLTQPKAPTPNSATTSKGQNCLVDEARANPSPAIPIVLDNLGNMKLLCFSINGSGLKMEIDGQSLPQPDNTYNEYYDNANNILPQTSLNHAEADIASALPNFDHFGPLKSQQSLDDFMSWLLDASVDSRWGVSQFDENSPSSASNALIRSPSDKMLYPALLYSKPSEVVQCQTRNSILGFLAVRRFLKP